MNGNTFENRGARRAKAKKNVMAGAVTAMALAVGFGGPIANAVESQTVIVGIPEWLPIDIPGAVASDPDALGAVFTDTHDSDPDPGLFGLFNPVTLGAPVWSSTIVGTPTFTPNSTGPGSNCGFLNAYTCKPGVRTGLYQGSYAIPSSKLTAAALGNWTTYLTNLNFLAYGDGAIATGEAYRQFILAAQAGDPDLVGAPLTDDRSQTWDGTGAPLPFTQNVIYRCGKLTGICSYVDGTGSTPNVVNPPTLPPPAAGAGAPQHVIPGGVIDMRIITLFFLRNPGRPNGGIYSRFAPIYQELTGVNPVSPERTDLNLPAGLDLAALLNGDFSTTNPLALLSLLTPTTLEGLDGKPIVLTIKVDLTWEYDLMSDAPVTANPIAWANSLASSLLVTQLASILAGIDPTDSDTLPVELVSYIVPQGEYDAGTFYGTLATGELPLAGLLRLPAQALGLLTGQDINTPLADALEPMLKILVNIGYNDVVTPADLAANPALNALYDPYDRTLKQMHVPTLFGTETLTRAELARLPGDLIAALGGGIGNELTDINQRALVQFAAAASELGITIPGDVSAALAQAAPKPGVAITTFSHDVGQGVSEALANIESQLPPAPPAPTQAQLGERQKDVGMVLADVKDEVDPVIANVNEGIEKATVKVNAIVDKIKAGLDDSKTTKSIAAKETKSKTPVKDAVKKAGNDLKKAADKVSAKVKKALTPKKKSTE